MMFNKLLTRIIGTGNQRELNRISRIVLRINELEKSISSLSDEELRNKTVEFKKRLKEGETLDDVLPEAFAVVREAGIRTVRVMSPGFDVYPYFLGVSQRQNVQSRVC